MIDGPICKPTHYCTECKYAIKETVMTIGGFNKIKYCDAFTEDWRLHLGKNWETPMDKCPMLPQNKGNVK